MERSTRAWMSIVVVQAMGSVWMCYAKQKAASHYISTLPALSRAHALPLALLCILRIVLIFDFRNVSVHVAHILLSIITAIHTMSEVFYYQAMSYGIVTVTEVTLNCFSVVVMLCFILSSSFNSSESDGNGKRPRKVIAKHYMEAEMLTPDEDDELVQAYKKWK
ncbi:hypothetical protein GCK72_018350 [Caenorhabditis remanei]|uniref:Uncharacterized protein n=1 Tax=Caenorhabditis remanei TaxID=31234 RepID=A0A6A5GAE8_CAERE|nr:hypothetical protein GCK72_018350 [Caenorhabditis remanei]KAF1751796.1 hypothetical protein GCK72_018350 [Caenorhabditis remanei]